MKAIISETFRLLYWFPFRKIVQALPLRAGYALAAALSVAGYVFMRRKRRLTERGLLIMYGGKMSMREARAECRRTFKNFFKKSIEVLWYPKLTPGMCDRLFTFEGLENLDRGLAKGVGVVLLHGHFGNPHMIMPALGFRGYKLNQLGSRNPPQDIDMPGVFNLLRRKIYEIKLGYKETLPVNFIYTDKSIKGAMHCLKKSEVLAIAIDGREGTKWMEVDFLRQRAFFSTGAMNLIMRMNPVVLPTIVIRQDDDTHKVVINPPAEMVCTNDKNEGIRRNLENFLTWFERYVMEYPSQYGDVFWLADRFFKQR